jgi:hypothetical protein
MDPEVFTERLKMEPQTKWKLGDRRKTPTGTLLEGHYERSYWYSLLSRPEDPDDVDLPGYLDRTLKHLTAHQEFFQEIRITGGKVELFVGVFAGAGNIGATLTHDLMADFGKMGMDLAVDIYDSKNPQAL